MFEKLNERNRKEQYISRRKFWMEAGMGIGGLALLDLMSQDKLLGAECVAGAKIDSPLSPKPTHFKPRAKSVISLFMSGGVSHMDTFDYKPALEKYNRMPMEGHGDIKVRQGYPGPLMSYRDVIAKSAEPFRRKPVSLSQILGRPVKGWEDESE